MIGSESEDLLLRGPDQTLILWLALDVDPLPLNDKGSPAHLVMNRGDVLAQQPNEKQLQAK